MVEARIPAPHGPAINLKTGHLNRDWWRFFHDLWQRSGGTIAVPTLQPTEIGKSVQAWDAQLDDFAALAVTDSNFVVADGTNWVAESGATARTSLGLGTSDAAAFGSLTLTTNLAIAQGGTGASTASAARTALGVVIGTDVQAQRTITAAGGVFLADGDGVSGNPTIDGALQVFETTVGQAALASGGEVILLNAVTGETWKVIDIILSADGTNFSGGGGDRLLSVTDGTSTWTVIAALDLQTLAVARWGDKSGNVPNPATASHLFAASASGTDIVAKYSGGATDYTAGSLTLRIIAYRTA